MATVTRSARLAAVLLAALASGATAAPTKITLGVTTASEFAPCFIAKERGFFEKRGLDVEIQIITLNSNIPTALQADSIQIGGPTASTLLQAVDGGLDLVVVAGGAFGSKTNENYGLVERAGAGIKEPKDLIGKKVGVSGLNTFNHVLFRKWLLDKGVDYTTVTFVEVPFPQMNDVLKAGTVDAVVPVDPFMTRIVKSGAGAVVWFIAKDLPEGLPAFVYSAKRQWAEANGGAARGFREAIAEGVAFAEKDLEGARADLGKYIQLPPPVLATIRFVHMSATVTGQQMQLWVDIMREQKMLRSTPNVEKLIVQ